MQDTRPLRDAQPIMDSVQQVGHNLMHPIDYIKQMLQGPPPPVQQGPTMVDEANQSFRHPGAVQPAAPVVAPPRRKPMGGM